MTNAFRFHRSSQILCAALWALLLLGFCTLANAQAVAPGTAAPVAPPRGTTVIDRLQLPSGEVRTLPSAPPVGVWGLVIGRPEFNAKAVIQLDKPGQAVIYPTRKLLERDMGTIEFKVKVTTAIDPADAAPRVLLDSWPVNGNSRLQLTLVGQKMTLSLAADNGQAKTCEGMVANWAPDSSHSVDVQWSADFLTLLIDGREFAKVEKPVLPGIEPLALALGNNRDFQAPAKMGIYDLHLSTALEINGSALPAAKTTGEQSFKMAQDYANRMYPLFDRLRQQNVGEVAFAYALAYSDIGDLDRALQQITPITRDTNHPLFVQAVFLRANLLASQKDFTGAYEQLQVLVGRDVTTSVNAMVRQAQILYEQGNKTEAMSVIKTIIDRYSDQPAIKEAYILVGLKLFNDGNYEDALRALTLVDITNARPREKVSIGIPFQLKVADPDMGFATSADVGIKVTVSSTGGDKETFILRPAFSKGVFVGNIDSTLGEAKPGDSTLQVRGKDKLTVSYIDRLSDQGENKERTIPLELANDAKLVILAQSALDIYREVLDYQKRNIIDDSWVLIGTLPKGASAFFRNPEDGTLRKKGFRFDQRYIANIKAGQAVYIELTDFDRDLTPQPDTLDVQLETQSKRTMTVTLTETGPDTGIFAAVVKTAPEGQAKEGELEVGKNDAITTYYEDKTPSPECRDPRYRSQVAIRVSDGTIAAGINAVVTTPDGPEPVFLRMYRVSAKETIVVTVTDRDLDTTDQADTIKVKVKATSGAEMELTLKETGTHTGVFTGQMKIDPSAAAPAPAAAGAAAPAAAPAATPPAASAIPTLKVKPGDMITASYVDEETTKSTAVTREYTFKANAPESAKIVFLRQIVEMPKTVERSTALLAPLPTKITWQETNVLVPGSLYRIRLTDGDLYNTNPDVPFYTKMTLTAPSKATVDVGLLAVEFDKETLSTIFEGSVYVALGDINSPSRAFYTTTGMVMEIKGDEEEISDNLNYTIPAINVQGKDKITATYIDAQNAEGKPNLPRVTSMSVVSDAEIDLLNLQGNPIEEALKPGMPFELQVKDGNGDLTVKRDTLKATVLSSNGDTLDVELEETDIHSGIFSAVIKTAYGATAVKNNIIELPFEGKLTVKYRDEETTVGTAKDVLAELPTRQMSDADAMLLTKVFEDQKFEVETLVKLGESRYAVGAAELAKSKPEPGVARTNDMLQDSARLLQLVIDRFPTSDYVVECLYLTGKIRKEETKYSESVALFNRVIEEYPDSDFVPMALYQLVLMYYDQDDITKATESAMRLVYGFPKNPLLADAVLRIAEYYYSKKKEYVTAASIYKRLLERFPDNPRADLIRYRMATAYYRAGLATEPKMLDLAIRYYMEFVELYKDHELADDALYWAANAYLKQNNVRRCYTLLTRLLVNYSDSDMKAYAVRMRDKIKEDYPTITAEDF